MNKDPDLVTVPVKDLLYCLLGDEVSGSPCTAITPDIALVLRPKLETLGTYYIQLSDFNGTPLSLPVLWRMGDWIRSNAKHLSQKAYSEKCRVESFIRKENEDRTLAHLCREYGFDEEHGRDFARRLVAKGNIAALQGLGVRKVVTKESEL